MAKTVRKVQRTQKKSILSPFTIYWEKTNYLLFLAGIIVCIIGFYCMSVQPWNSSTSLVISPILLFIGYAVIFPAAILYRRKNKEVQEEK